MGGDAGEEVGDMTTQRKRKFSFEAQDNQGNTYQLDMFSITGGTHVDQIRQAIKTTHGRRVTRLEKGKYRIVATGETLTSEDPQAP